MLAQPDPQPPRVESCYSDERSAAGLTAHETNPAVFIICPEPT